MIFLVIDVFDDETMAQVLRKCETRHGGGQPDAQLNFCVSTLCSSAFSIR